VIKLTTSVSFMQAPTAPTSRIFYELAARHGGFFTTAEASQAGISYRQLSYYVASEALERVSHGVYRLIDYPLHPHGDMIAATLWAGPDSAISHESALAVYRLALAMPPVIHLTVPSSFRGRRDGVRIHHEKLEPDERRLWDDVPVTTVERTIIDVSRSSDRSLLRDAVRESLEQGLSTRRRLADAISCREDRARIARDLGLRLPTVRKSA
jgi:predicted transcriptional regulator of viral defense system